MALWRFDSITKLFANEIARESERLTDAGKKNEFGADKKPGASTICANLAQLAHAHRYERDLYLTAGEVAEWGTDNKGERAQIGTIF